MNYDFRKELEQLRSQVDNVDVLRMVDALTAQIDRERLDTARKLNRLAENQRTLDNRILAVENSRLFRALQRVSRHWQGWQTRGKLYNRSARAQSEGRDYQLWLQREELAAQPASRFAAAIQGFRTNPRFSFLMTVDRPRREWLHASIASIQNQSYQDWELCISEDACEESWVSKYLHELEQSDSRVHFVRSEQRMGPASSLNRANILAGGAYVALHDQHDVLAPNALFYAAEALQEQPLDLIYSDDDQFGPMGVRERPSFKPGWSPDLLDTNMYLGGFMVISKEELKLAGGFQTESDGAHLYDLALRISERRPAVKHLPHVLSTRRSRQTSPDQERRAVHSALQRRGLSATVEEQAGGFRIHRKLLGTPLASLIICSRTPKLLGNCLEKIERLTAYPVREIVVVQHKTGDDAGMERLLERSHCVRVLHAGPFDFAAMNNRGAEVASGGILIFLNDDIEPLCATWLTDLLAQAQRPEVGVVGSQLLYPSGLIQHAGIAVGIMDGTGHPHRGTSGGGFWNWSFHARNVSAVTGACMAVRRQVFEELGGFDARFPVNYNDVDLCLRARQAGYQVICEPAARLQHFESRTRAPGVSWQERELWHERWGEMLETGDPYYSPNLARSREDCSLSDG